MKALQDIANEKFKTLHVDGGKYNIIEDLLLPLMLMVRIETIKECRMNPGWIDEMDVDSLDI